MTEPRSSTGTRDDALRYLEAFRRHWKLILVLVVAAVAAATAASYAADEKYEAHADVLITPLEQGDDTFRGFTLFRTASTSASAVVLAARVLSSEEIYAEAYRRLGERGAGVSIGLQPLSQTDVVVVNATAPDSRTAALAANTFAEVAVEQRTAAFQDALAARIENLEKRADEVPEGERSGNFEYASMQQQLGELKAFVGAPDPTLTLLRPATPPGAPSWPRTKLAIAVAFSVALLIGAALAVGLEFLNPRVMREEDVSRGDRLPILARVPRFDGGSVRKYLSGRSSTLPPGAWNSYRTLRAVLGSAGGDYPRSILVTSATPGDGKTMTAVNLAITLASANVRVILVDADPFRPMIADAFNVPQREDGLVRLLAGDDVRDVLVPAGKPPGLQLVLARQQHVSHIRTPAWWASSTSVPKWTVVEPPADTRSAGETRVATYAAPDVLPTAEHLVDSGRIASVLDRLREHADVVVIDSPPVTEVAETLAIAEAVDAVLVAVRLGHTQREKLAQLLDLFARRNVSPVGFVVTVRDSPKPYYGYPDNSPVLPIQLQQPRNDVARRARDSAQ